MDEKVCTCCSESLPFDAFGKDSSRTYGLSLYCKNCTRSKAKKRYYQNPQAAKERQYRWVEGNRDKVNASSKRWRDTSPEGIRLSKRKSYLKARGLTLESYDALVKSQEGRCAICHDECDDLFIDHDHSCCPSAKGCQRCIRGLLCTRCNTGIGFLRESYVIMESAMEYLRSYSTSHTKE